MARAPINKILPNIPGIKGRVKVKATSPSRILKVVLIREKGDKQQFQPQQYEHVQQIGGINVEGLSAMEAKKRTTQSVADK